MECKREQKVAYNFLFSDCHINGMNLESILKDVDYHQENRVDFIKHKFKTDLIKQCIIKNYEQYKQKPFIAGSYSEIADKLPL